MKGVEINLTINKLMKFKIKYIIFILLFFTCAYSFAGKKKDIIIIHDSTISICEKEAIIVLPGLGDSKKGRKCQADFLKSLEYDVFIPNYIDYNSVQGSLNNFSIFFEKHHLSKYKKIHVFSYILGSWVINLYINKYGTQNIQTIVYDRSPIQEQAPFILVQNIPFITRLIKGKIVEDLCQTPYPPISDTNVKIGIIIESSATKLMRRFKKKIKKINDWNSYNFQQQASDKFFTELNHDEMYLHFKNVGNDILSFIRTGRFTTNAQREWFNWDPFKN